MSDEGSNAGNPSMPSSIGGYYGRLAGGDMHGPGLREGRLWPPAVATTRAQGNLQMGQFNPQAPQLVTPLHVLQNLYLLTPLHGLHE